MGYMENYEAFYQQPETCSGVPGGRKQELESPSVSVKRDGNGFAYEMWHGPDNDRRIFVSGWTAGTEREARKEAMSHANDKLRGS